MKAESVRARNASDEKWLRMRLCSGRAGGWAEIGVRGESESERE